MSALVVRPGAEAARASKPPSSSVPPIVAGRVPVHDLDAEAAVLSAAMLDGEALATALPILKPEHYYSEANGRIHEACAELFAIGKPVDVVTVASWLRDRERLQAIGGPGYLAQIVDATPAVHNVEAHAQVVLALWKQRAMVALSQRLSAEGYGDVGVVETWIGDAVTNIARIVETEATSRMISARDAAHDFLKRMQEDPHPGDNAATGFVAIDNVAKFGMGDLTIVAGRPGMGKSAFVGNWATNLCSVEVPEGEPRLGVSVMSLEMPREQLTDRWIVSGAGVSLEAIRRRQITPSDWQRLTASAAQFEKFGLEMDDTGGMTLVILRAKVRQAKMKLARRGFKLRLVIIDYLQLMNGSGQRGQNREQEISQITRGLKQLAKDEDVHVVALSQLNRGCEDRSPPKPEMRDLRESGAIEQDADNILFVYRPEYYERVECPPEQKGHAEIIIAKQRNGPAGISEWLRFYAHCARFENAAVPPT